jgi:hypothetical protein
MERIQKQDPEFTTKVEALGRIALRQPTRSTPPLPEAAGHSYFDQEGHRFVHFKDLLDRSIWRHEHQFGELSKGCDR